MSYDILGNLAASGATWTLTPVTFTPPHAPGERPFKPRTVHQLTLTLPDGRVLEHRQSFHSELTLSQQMAVLLAKRAKDHPMLAQWYYSHGNYQVRLADGVLDNLGEAVHTALRKLADGKVSVITWRAIHALAPDDRGALWQAIRAYLEAAFNTSATRNRRTLATGLQEHLVKFLDNRGHEPLMVERPAGCEPRDRTNRTDAEKFALVALSAGASLTEIDEWMYGWLGYVVAEALLAEPPLELTQQELADALRFCVVCEDGEGYDVPRPRMKRLEVLGLVVDKKFGRFHGTPLLDALQAEHETGEWVAFRVQAADPAPSC